MVVDAGQAITGKSIFSYLRTLSSPSFNLLASLSSLSQQQPRLFNVRSVNNKTSLIQDIILYEATRLTHIDTWMDKDERVGLLSFLHQVSKHCSSHNSRSRELADWPILILHVVQTQICQLNGDGGDWLPPACSFYLQAQIDHAIRYQRLRKA